MVLYIKKQRGITMVFDHFSCSACLGEVCWAAYAPRVFGCESAHSRLAWTLLAMRTCPSSIAPSSAYSHKPLHTLTEHQLFGHHARTLACVPFGHKPTLRPSCSDTCMCSVQTSCSVQANSSTIMLGHYVSRLDTLLGQVSMAQLKGLVCPSQPS